MAGDCPKGQFACVHCGECVSSRTPYAVHIARCVVNQKHKRPKGRPEGGRRSTDGGA